MYSYDFAFLDADKRMYHQYYEMLLQLVCRSGWSQSLCGIDRGKNSDPEKNMLSCPLWHISIKHLHVIKAVVLYITTLMCELLSKSLRLVHECLQLTKSQWQVRSNGLVVVDNILWYGRTANPLV
jgi:hypothetical protein